MKNLFNLIIFVAIIVVVVVRSFFGEGVGEGQSDGWLIALCTTAVVVNGALALAGALVRRRVLMQVVWATVFLMIGCGIWAVRFMPLGEEETAFRREAQRQDDPFARDEEGECLFTRAAALGKEEVVRHIIDTSGPSDEVINEAGRRAAEGNRVGVLDCLARVGLQATAVSNGVPLLVAAAQNGCCDAMKWLIMRGAPVDTRDEEGSTALIQAVQSGRPEAVKLLLEKGADPKLRDAAGLRAEEYARTEQMEQLFTPASPEPTSSSLP